MIYIGLIMQVLLSSAADHAGEKFEGLDLQVYVLAWGKPTDCPNAKER